MCSRCLVYVSVYYQYMWSRCLVYVPVSSLCIGSRCLVYVSVYYQYTWSRCLVYVPVSSLCIGSRCLVYVSVYYQYMCSRCLVYVTISGLCIGSVCLMSKKEKDKTWGLNPVPKVGHFLVCCTEISVKYMYYYNHSECISQKEKDKKVKHQDWTRYPRPVKFITPVMNS